jgi:glutathione synthase/RimK-type ligase-like ATP-grasp enzyme
VPRLVNPAPVLAWNTDKRYLDELAAAGLPTVPTTFLAPGDAFAAPDGAELVVKPTVSAGSRDTRRHDGERRDAAIAHVAELHAAGRTAMVQPYLGDVDHAGETALLHFDGALSHAIRKGPMLAHGRQPPSGLYAIEDIVAREPSAAELAVSERVMAAVAERFGTLLYARVDLLPGPDGAPVLIELELTEPSLFFAHAPGSAERFARAIAARL